MKDTVSKFDSDLLKLSHKLCDNASELRKEDLLEGFLRQLGFAHDWGFWRYSGEKNSLSLMVINNHIEIDLCIGNNERFSPGRMFKFIAGSLYTNTITDENIETIVEQLVSLLGIDFVQDVDNTFHGVKQINKFKLEIVLSQTDADYIDIDSKLIGKENTFRCNTFARSKYHDVFLSLNDITHNTKVLVSSIENFTK